MLVSVVPEAEYYQDLRIVASVEALNSVGLDRIVTNSYTDTTGNVPLAVCRPLQRADEPIESFDEVIARTYGFANGHRLVQHAVVNTMIAEITGKPVIGVPSPDRDWPGAHDREPTRHWYNTSDEERVKKSIAQNDAVASKVVDAICGLIGGGRIDVFGDSYGSMQSLSIMHLAKDRFDLGGASLLALPNNEHRKVFLELLGRDFAHSQDHEGGMRGQVLSGDPQLVPFYQAHGFDNDIKPTKTQEVFGFLDYLHQDMFGKRFKNFLPNLALARAIAAPSSVPMLERMIHQDGVTDITLGFFEHDIVARMAKFLELLKSRAKPAIEVLEFKGTDHAGCNNPYIIGYMATKLL